MKVAYLGPAGSFGHTVAELLFGKHVLETAGVACATNGDVVNKVAEGAEFGVVPIENSKEGPVGGTLDAMYRAWLGGHNVYAFGTKIMPIRHQIIGLPGAKSGDITTVMSHPQAYGQCRRTIARRLGEPIFVATTSTADAVRQMVEKGDPRIVSVASRRAAEIHGGKVLISGCQDARNNTTRFLVLSAVSDHERTGKDVTMVMLSCPNVAGSLVGVLSSLASHGINMNMVMSLSGEELGDYRFCLGFEGHREDPKVACALEMIKEVSEWLYVFGSFPAK